MSDYAGAYGDSYGGAGGYGQQNRAPYGGNPYGQQAQNPYAQQGTQQAQNPYAQAQGSGYSQQNQQRPYGQQQQNPFGDQRQGAGYAQPGGAYSGDVEMNQMGNGVSPESRILNDISDIQRGIQQTSGNLETIKRLQQQSLDDPDASQNTQVNRQLDNLSADTMTQFRAFTERLNKIRAMPDSGSQNCKGPVGSTQSSLKKAMQSYQTVDAEYRKKLQAQMARQYRIVRPEASEQEVREACEDTQSTQVFSQALLQSDRRGQSQSALRAVQGRHEAIQKIERSVIELAQLMEDMNVMVVQQEATVQQIDQQAENVNQDVTNANTHLTGAVDKARAARKKKWICLGIVVLIIIIIAVVLAIIFGVVKPQNK